MEKLADKWDAPISAHVLERAYLDGGASYPPAEPSVGGGLMPLIAPLFPKGPSDVTRRLHTLLADGSSLWRIARSSRATLSSRRT